jgi:hypothetical protein
LLQRQSKKLKGLPDYLRIEVREIKEMAYVNNMNPVDFAGFYF